MKIGQLKNMPNRLISSDAVVPSNYVITNTLDTTLYYDVTSIENWDRFGIGLADDINIVRDGIKAIVDNLGWVNLSPKEKKIASKFFAVGKANRDEIFSDEEQKKNGEDLVILKNRAKTAAGDAIFDKTSDEVTNFLNATDGHFINYLELNDDILPLANGVWHIVQTNATPNSVLLIDIRNSTGKKFGGVRQVGSTSNRLSKITANSSFTLPVKVDGQSRIEVYRQDNKITFKITAQLS